MKHSVLIVEDESELAALLSKQLEQIDCSVEVCSDGELGLSRALSGSFDLVILDVSLPKLDGFSVCKKLRDVNHETSVLMLTARGEEIDIVTGFDVGANDYVAKPFRLAELIARVKALLNRSVRSKVAGSTQGGAEEILVFGNLRIDTRRRKIFVKGEQVELTAKEFDLIFLLANNPGTVFTRDQLLRLVWDDEAGIYLFSVNAMVARVRKKIEENPSQPKFLLTHRGTGYRFVERHELD